MVEEAAGRERIKGILKKKEKKESSFRTIFQRCCGSGRHRSGCSAAELMLPSRGEDELVGMQ